MWARVHKLDRVKPHPGGGAIVYVEDDRTVAQMKRVPSLSTLVAIARVLAAHRALDAKFGGKGEVRYAASAQLPSELSEAITRAGALIVERSGDTVIVPAQPSGVDAIVDVAFAGLAHHVRGTLGITELGSALLHAEDQRRASPLDRDKDPEKYWTAVLELAALAGELSRKKGGRWVTTRDLPLPYALKFPEGISHPTVVAQNVVEGGTEIIPR